MELPIDTVAVPGRRNRRGSNPRASSSWSEAVRDGQLLVASMGTSELPAAEPRLGRRTARTFAAPSSSAQELIAAIGLEPRNGYSGRHLEPLQNLSGSGID